MGTESFCVSRPFNSQDKSTTITAACFALIHRVWQVHSQWYKQYATIKCLGTEEQYPHDIEPWALILSERDRCSYLMTLYGEEPKYYTPSFGQSFDRWTAPRRKKIKMIPPKRTLLSRRRSCFWLARSTHFTFRAANSLRSYLYRYIGNAKENYFSTRDIQSQTWMFQVVHERSITSFQ